MFFNAIANAGGEGLPAPAVVDVRVPALTSSLHEALEKTADTGNSGLDSCGVRAAEIPVQRRGCRRSCRRWRVASVPEALKQPKAILGDEE